MIEAEQKTCTIRVLNRKSDQQGILFFRDGKLMDARLEQYSGVKAAYAVLSWEEASLSIQNTCANKHEKIDSVLNALKSQERAGSGTNRSY